jgi:hypothetical protein
VGENLRRNPGDLLKPIATVPLWDRFVHGNSQAGDAWRCGPRSQGNRPASCCVISPIWV